RDVRSLADWTIKRRLQSVSGIAEILNMGGGVKQIEIRPDPYKMQAHDVTYDELERAATEAATTTTGGFISSGPAEIMVRNLAMTVDLHDIGRTVIKKADDRPIAINDVAEVVWGVEPMRGDATVSQAPEKSPTYGVIMSITKAPGFDTRKLTEQIQAALEELKPTFAKGVETTLLFQQKDFIDHAIGNLTEAIREGAIMVTVVLFLFLLNFRTTFITLMAMPLSFGITLLTFQMLGISVNSMTLGGLAVAIGMVVDDAIVDVENVFRRLRENAALGDKQQPKLQVIAQASGEVRNSILYATVLIILVFLPLLGLTGVEGKLFAPIAIATIISMIASFVVSLTAIPVLCSLLLNPKAGHEHKDGRLVRGMKSLLQHTLLRFALRHPSVVLLVSLVLMIAAFSLYPQMNKDFLPKFQEETALVAATAAPGTSLDEMNKISDVIEQQILSVPEVRKVGRRLGRAERGDHVVPVSTAEFDVDFRDPEGGKGTGRTRKDILDDLGRRIKTVPGVFAVVGGPLADRIGHMMSGVSAPVAVKVFGPDLDKLRQIGIEIQTVAKSIPGFEDCKLDQTSSIPQLRVEADRDRAKAYGIAPGQLNDQLSTLIGGKEVAELREGQRAVNLVIRLPAEWRDSPDKIAQLPIEVEGKQRVPLSLVADVREAKGPNVIFRESSQRRFALGIKPTVRDVSNLVVRLQNEVKEKVKLPEGYFITYEGEFQAQQEATQRIAIFSAVVFVAVFLMLYGYFRSGILAMQVLVNIPLALMGGLVYTYFKLNNISIATLVGFIAVGGVAARNGIMMISHYLHLMKQEGEGFTRAMVARGTLERLVPVLMTALSAGIGLIPLVLAADQPGKEILHPVAVVIVGGLISSTFLDMAITPAMFWLFGRKASAQAIAQNAAAAH
ncbi:MAG TPA: efflux RND transporter permease subunit, partial [Prosthecobacter sp.]